MGHQIIAFNGCDSANVTRWLGQGAWNQSQNNRSEKQNSVTLLTYGIEFSANCTQNLFNVTIDRPNHLPLEQLVALVVTEPLPHSFRGPLELTKLLLQD